MQGTGLACISLVSPSSPFPFGLLATFFLVVSIRVIRANGNNRLIQIH